MPMAPGEKLNGGGMPLAPNEKSNGGVTRQGTVVRETYKALKKN